jgi:hypothetical protein
VTTTVSAQIDPKPLSNVHTTSFVKVLRRPLESAQYVSIKYTDRLAEAGIEPSAASNRGYAPQSWTASRVYKVA